MPNLDRYLDGRTLILLSNREPYEHVRGEHGPDVRQPPGGLVSALDPTMRRSQGVWVAWGSGNADRETADESGRLHVPPDAPAYTLRRVWLDDEDIEGYYLGFANSALWPLCHMLIQHFHFRGEQWDRYQAVNARFADAVAEEARRACGEPIVWIQDYHFARVADLLRRKAPELFIHQFWHIPFPPPDILRLLPIPVHDAVLRGLLGNDLVAFHTERYALNFLMCVEQAIPEAAVDFARRTVRVDGRTIAVGAFPISIDVEHYEQLAMRPESRERARALRATYAHDGRQLGVSVDRLDYTKGIPQRLRALDLLWTQSPELRGRMTVVVVAPPSRSEIAAYSSLQEDVDTTVRDINARHGTEDWTPIVLLFENVSAELLASVYRAADLCLVSSLQDGMNLVAKEFVACQVDECGVLVLSRFTGAAEEIEGAVLINPFNIDGFAAGIRSALEMPAEERRWRMRQMRQQLHGATIFDWLDAILSKATGLMARRALAGARTDAERSAGVLRAADLPRDLQGIAADSAFDRWAAVPRRDGLPELGRELKPSEPRDHP
jgi:alpha,alpha-trehalose-phosphate synthase [UDP-forming]